jgi:hypothetical protein
MTFVVLVAALVVVFMVALPVATSGNPRVARYVWVAVAVLALWAAVFVVFALRSPGIFSPYR